MYKPGLGKSDHLTLMFDYICFISNESASENKNSTISREITLLLGKIWKMLSGNGFSMD